MCIDPMLFFFRGMLVTLRFMTRLCQFIADLDAGRLLHWRTFATDRVEEHIAELRNKAVYLRRSQSLYEKFINLPIQKLYHQAVFTFFYVSFLFVGAMNCCRDNTSPNRMLMKGEFFILGPTHQDEPNHGDVLCPDNQAGAGSGAWSWGQGSLPEQTHQLFGLRGRNFKQGFGLGSADLHRKTAAPSSSSRGSLDGDTCWVMWVSWRPHAGHPACASPGHDRLCHSHQQLGGRQNNLP